ncbi:MAG: hypothetical protein Q9217_002406 [Psora testacea]
MDNEEIPNLQSFEEDETHNDRSYRPRLVGLSRASDTFITSSSVTSEVTFEHKKDSTETVCSNGGTIDYFTRLQWSPDGTTILLNTATNGLNTYVLPPDLLDPAPSKPYHNLEPYNTHGLPEPTHATIIHPSYSLSTPETCLYLTSPCNLPIRLLSPFAKGILASYPLVNTTTEAWIAPHSLLFAPLNVNIFFAGADGLIASFDLQRDGQGPVTTIYTRKGRKRKTGIAAILAANDQMDGAPNVRGIVSAMAINTNGVLAVGTFTGKLGLLDVNKGLSPLITECFLPEETRNGITSVHFHPSPSYSNYLLAASRLSTSMHLFDIRNPASPLSILKDRPAITQQRLSVDFTENGAVWAGGTDGVVKVWEGIGMHEGEVQAAWGWDAHEDVVGGVGVHPGGAGVVASCSGSRRYGLLRSNTRGDRPEGKDVEDSEGSDTDTVSSEAVSANSTSSLSSVSSSTGSETIPESSLKVWVL